MTKFKLLIISLFAITQMNSEVKAQGIEVFYDIGSVIKSPGQELGDVPFNLGIGYEHNINERVSMALSIAKDVNGFLVAESITNSSTVGNYYYDWSADINQTDVTLESKYFFSDNDESAMFFSFSASLYTLNYSYRFENGYSFYGNPPSDIILDKRTNAKQTITPLTFKLGYRGALNRFFGETSAGIRFNLGHDNTPSKGGFKYLPVERKGVSLIVTLGIGIGWDK